jgi:Brp/Blh family beta-carotene 15,15'-monooxygenase
MVALFFILTVWHWGSADAPEPRSSQDRGQWLMHSVLRGGLIFTIPALCWPLETRQIVNGLLEFVGAELVREQAFTWAARCLGGVIALGHIALGGIFIKQKQWGLLGPELLELSLLGALFAALPPILSSGVYFVFWHSLRHVLRMNRLMGYSGAPAGWRQLLRETQFFTLRSLPLLLISLAALGALCWYLAPRLPDGLALLSLGLVVAAVVTLPHALLVTLVMDANKWQLSKPKAKA